MDGFAGASFLPSTGVHSVHFQIVANFFYGDQRSVIVGRVSSCGEELVVNAGMDIVF